MPRYENDAEFWDITHDGKRLVIVTGVLGRPGKETVRMFVSPAHALTQFAKLTGEKQQAGWTYVERPTEIETDGLGEDHDPALEAAINANPYDETAYSVYSDWLQSRNAPRGELIALQLAEENTPDDQRLRAATRAHVQSHRRAFELGLEKHSAIQGRDGPALVWRFGFIHRIELDRSVEPVLDSAAVIADVLAHRSGRFVAEISLREYDAAPLDAAVAAIAKLARPTLRSIAVMSRGGMGSLSALVALPLRQLIVKGRSGDLGRECLDSLAHVPSTLDTLDVRTGPEDEYGALAQLFRRTDLVALRNLTLRGCAFANEVCDALASSAFVHQLEQLDLALSPITKGKLEHLADRALSPALRHVGLSRDEVSPAAIAAFKARGIKVTFVRRDPDDCAEDAGDDYYDEVQE